MKKSKKIFIFTFFIILCNLVSSVSASSSLENTASTYKVTTEDLAIETYTLESSITSEAVLIMEESTGKVIYEKNAYERRFPASTTKIMTAILALENCKLEDTATASEYAIMSIPSGYSNANIQVGETLTIKDLLYSLMVTSANESAIILGEHISGSEEAFCWLMNDKAKELGCKDTHFVNPNGIHKDDHYSTAYDLALMAKYAMQNETFRQIVKTTEFSLPSTDSYSGEERHFYNTNNLIRSETNWYYEYATGIKTGFTSQAGNCLVSSAEKDGVSYIAVVLNAPVRYENGRTISARYLDTTNLFEYAFNNYHFSKMKSTNDLVKTITIENGKKKENSLNLLIASDVNVLLSVDNNEVFEPEITLNENLNAPIKKGDIVGNITYKIDGLKYTADLLAGNDVEVMEDEKTVIFVVISGFIIILFMIRFVNKRKKYKKKRNKYR